MTSWSSHVLMDIKTTPADRYETVWRLEEGKLLALDERWL